MSTMRIHSDTLAGIDFFEAARIARVSLDYTRHGSRIRTRSFDVSLRGESNRRPNDRGAYPDDRAATWDQWGVFLAVLFDRDPSALCGTGVKNATYRSRSDFHRQTDDRFRPYGIVTPDTPGALAVTGDPDYDGTVAGPVYRQERTYWPKDYHGDHSWKPSGTPGVRWCRKCSAVDRTGEKWQRVSGWDAETEALSLSDCKHWDKPGTECAGPRVGKTSDGVILCERHYNQQG